MGTSKSYGGPSDVSRLLPSWALPGDESASSEGTPPEADSPSDSTGPTDSPASATAPADGQSTQPGPPVAVPRLEHYPWRAAKGSMSRAVRGSGDTRDYRRAAKNYVHAHGGSRSAAKSAVAGRRATARFASFLTSIPSLGVAAAVRALGLASFAGRPVDDVLASMTNALAPDGATLEEAAARQAIAETLAGLYDAWGIEDGGLERLQAMTADDIRTAVTESIGAYIFHRWALDLGLAIERRAISTRDAVTMEGEMRQYIRDRLRLDLAKTDVLSVDWSGDAGRRIIDSVFEEAYSLIETSI